MNSKYVTWKTKIGIYKTMIRPNVTYACEIWVLNKTEEDMLNRWKRKMVRAIFMSKEN